MSRTTKTPKPAAGLSDAARAWWKKLTDEYEFDTPDAVLILETVVQSFDRWQQAKALVDTEGPTVRDRFQQPKINPAVLVERDSKQTMLRALKQLGLDVLPPGQPGRPAIGS